MENLLDHSFYQSFQTDCISAAFSIKYVIAGREIYYIDGKEHAVKPGQALLVHPWAKGHIDFSATFVTEGICAFISNEVMQQCLMARNDNNELNWHPEDVWQLDTGRFATSMQFAGDCHSLDMLPKVYDAVKNPGTLMMGPDLTLFYELAENFLNDQASHQGEKARLKTVRDSTRRELYYRLTLAKSFLHDNFIYPLNVADAARAAMLSEYHFFRLYKQVFGITPYRYITKLRLHHAKQLLQQGEESVAAIALQCGFKEQQSFSKAFKLEFGIAPSKVVSGKW